MHQSIRNEVVAPQYRLLPETSTQTREVGRFLIYGGLIYDEDADSPLSSDANGSIVHYTHHASKLEFFRAQGLDDSGNKDLKLAAVSTHLAAQVCEALMRDRGMMTRLSNLLKVRKGTGRWSCVLKEIREIIEDAGWDDAMDYIAQTFMGEHWRYVSDADKERFEPLTQLTSEEAAERSWEALKGEEKIGAPLAVVLDIYEHGMKHYSVSGEGPQCRWDTSRGAAVWIPDDYALQNIQATVCDQLKLVASSVATAKTWHQCFQELLNSKPGLTEAALRERFLNVADSYCKGVLSEYNSWVQGEAYGVVAYVTDTQTGERVESEDFECWGFIGRSYAESELISTMDGLVKQLSNRH